MHSTDLPPSSRRGQWLARACPLGVALASIIVLYGWAQDITVLKSVSPNFITMKVNTAIGLLLLALATICLGATKRLPLFRGIAKALSAGTIILGLLTLYEYLSGTDLGIDEWLFLDPDHSGRFPPGRFAPVTAVCFILLGSANLVTTSRRTHADVVSQFLVFVAFLSALQALLGYLAGSTFTFGSAFYTQMALNTSVLFILLCAGILLTQANRGIMQILLSGSAGGVMARHLIIAAVTLPPLVNWLAAYGQQLGLFDSDFGVLIRVEGNVVMFMAAVWVSATLLHRTDGSRRQSLAALEASKDLLQQSYHREQMAHAEAQRLYKEALTASRLKDEFLATMSHELRTPINVVHGFAELLSQSHTQTDARTKQAIDAILRNSKAQVALVNDLFDVSRIINGHLKLSIEAIDIDQAVTNALESTALAARAKEQTITADVGTELGYMIGDPLRLQQILWNLLANAVKFTPKGGHITVRVKADGPQVMIEIQDDGCGIDADFLPFVFDRFRQQDGSMTRREGGLGLGLAIVRHLVELHGGTVEARSSGPGTGAAFIVKLPLPHEMTITAQKGLSAQECSTPRQAPRLPPAPLLKGLNILIVDDAADVRLVVKSVLCRYGAEVRQAASAAEAYLALDEAKPDVLISDIAMPDENGYDLIRKVRQMELESGGHIPAAALSALTRDEDRILSIDAGFERHINKPVDAASLVEEVRRLADEQAQIRI